jgi:PAS domain S-box-containing protein
MANAQMEHLFGYRSDELVGKTVELLIPIRHRNKHPDLRSSFFNAPEPRTLGAGRELFGRRKDGSEFPIEIGLSPLHTESGLFVLASVIDITERRRAEKELQESQGQLQELSGRLLGAQEAERRRIARELHDDCGQTLALLSVEMDLLQQKPPQTSAQLGSRMDAMSARVKQLSSSIHELSHQLHPMKLEQLGLVAAVRGLCNEIGASHGVSIRFVHDELPEAIPHDAALCLYRIAQEALRNVIKHSGAQRGKVELRNLASAICLRVKDDGSGFDPGAAASQEGLGLASMRERLRLVNGELSIESRPLGGTQIEARVPLCATGSTQVELNVTSANS